MKKALLLLAYGGPEKAEQIEPFLKQLLQRDPLPPGLCERVEKKYRAVGGASPLPGICREIQQKLARKLGEIPVYLAFRYSAPDIAGVVREMAESGVTRIYALSLSPHSSKISSAAYYQALDKAASDSRLEIVRLENWYRAAAYNRLLADRILETAQANRFSLTAAQTHLLFSAHNIPRSYIAEGDHYVTEIENNIAAILRLLPTCSSSLAYQSKGNAPGAWLEPEIETHLLDLKKRGHTDIIIVPISFSMDHLETLYDLDLEIKAFCEQENLRCRRSRPANADDDFIEMLARFTDRRLADD